MWLYFSLSEKTLRWGRVPTLSSTPGSTKWWVSTPTHCSTLETTIKSGSTYYQQDVSDNQEMGLYFSLSEKTLRWGRVPTLSSTPGSTRWWVSTPTHCSTLETTIKSGSTYYQQDVSDNQEMGQYLLFDVHQGHQKLWQYQFLQ